MDNVIVRQFSYVLPNGDVVRDIFRFRYILDLNFNPKSFTKVISITYTHTYHSRFISEVEASRIFPDDHVLSKLLSCEEYCRRDRW
jgi:hypothetical protein